MVIDEITIYCSANGAGSKRFKEQIHICYVSNLLKTVYTRVCLFEQIHMSVCAYESFSVLACGLYYKLRAGSCGAKCCICLSLDDRVLF